MRILTMNNLGLDYPFNLKNTTMGLIVYNLSIVGFFLGSFSLRNWNPVRVVDYLCKLSFLQLHPLPWGLHKDLPYLEHAHSLFVEPVLLDEHNLMFQIINGWLWVWV